MSYVPRPIETDAVDLSKDQESLIEQLAANAHDVWARERMSNGWTWGQARDDAAKKHPCLVPYEQLPESEKVYDRQMVIQTIKAALALGYRIDRA